MSNVDINNNSFNDTWEFDQMEYFTKNKMNKYKLIKEDWRWENIREEYRKSFCFFKLDLD